MADFVTNILTKLFFKKIGNDEYGNKYFISKKKNSRGFYTRRVIYKGFSEPSKVPPMWNAWLRYNTDEPPKNSHYFWQKPHLPNLTGTKYAYSPRGIKGEKLEKYSGQYNAWTPE